MMMAMMIAIQLTILMASIIFHEIAHGAMANRLGDPTAKNLGRLSLKPWVHMDIVGSVIVPIALIVTQAPFFIGWAKPVPVQPHYFKQPYKGMMWVAIAGPLTNIALAILASLLLFTGFGKISQWFFYSLIYTIHINIVLACFNLIPIPPLDGSRILNWFLPNSGRELMVKLEKYGLLLVVLFISFGGFSVIYSRFVAPMITLLIPETSS